MLATGPSILAAAGEDLGLALAAVLVVGVGAQLLASHLRVPSILLLLVGGLIAGPGLDLVEPEAMLGELRFPVVSLAVGILLFEGGLGLRFRDLPRTGRGPIIRLITIGVATTWLIASLATMVLTDLATDTSWLLGAILVVSGPTVVIPLLRYVRVREPVNSVLRWEGIFIDPVGATLAIVVLDAIVSDEGPVSGVERVITTAVGGTAAGLLAAAVLVLLFSRHWVPDNLHNPVTLAAVVAAFAGADLIRPEAGLFATTVLGVALANQRIAPMAHIREFEEDLGQLILAGLFVVLGASIVPDNVVSLLPEALALSAVLVFVARPLAVHLSTVGSGLRGSERWYLVCVAPRGIVAASVSALFALELEEFGRPAPGLVSITFVVISATVVYSAVASRLGARWFRVGRPPARGVAFIGGPDWALEIAGWLTDREVPTLVITHDPLESRRAVARGLLTFTGRLDSEDFDLALETIGISSVVAVSDVPVLNAMGIDRSTELVGRANVYQLAAEDDAGREPTAAGVFGRRPFGADTTRESLDDRFRRGAKLLSVDRDTFDADRLRTAVALVELPPDDVAPAVLMEWPQNPPDPGVGRLYLSDPSDESRVEPLDIGSAMDQPGNGGSAVP